MDPTILLASPEPATPAASHVRTPYSQRKAQKPKSQSPQKTIASNNLSEKKDSDDDHKSSTAKDKPKHTVKPKDEIDAKDVPAPAPDTGLSSTVVHPTVIHSGILPVIPPSHAPTPTTSLAGASTLPALIAAATSSLTFLPTHTPTGPINGASRALGAKSDHSDGKNSKHISIVIVILITVAVACVFLGCLIFFWRVRSRPRKRSCPTPSLPVLQDAYVEQDFKADDESLFGGKERSSAVALPDSNGLYTWVQYNPKATETKGAQMYTQQQDLAPLPSALLSEKPRAAPPVRVPIPIQPVAQPTPVNPPLQQMQSALARAANRVSTLSMSIYPASPQSAHTNAGIGLAIGCASPLTGDGTPTLQRKPSGDRVSKSRKSNRHSLAATEYLDVYGGMASPYTVPGSAPATSAPIRSALRKSTSITANTSAAQGRARVKAGYIPGSTALRASSTVAGIATLGRPGDRTSMLGQTEEDMQYVLPPLSPAYKSDARRERDTRALTSALGLASPAPPHTQAMSPAPTIHPDDSITLAGDRMRPRRPNCNTPSHNRPQSEAMSPGTEASARLGNLMLAEFSSMASLPSTRTVATHGDRERERAPGKARVVPRKNVNVGLGVSTTTGGVGSGQRTAMDDRPPRVPSPPPLPTLAQMAMAHGNPDEYADYRSPTYSIYGLYEAERKSRMQGGEAGF